MGGLAGMYEEFREFIQNQGGDDPALLSQSLSHMTEWGISFIHNEREIGTHLKKIHQEFLFPSASSDDAVKACRLLISLCNEQDNAIRSLYDIHTPRSRSFVHWFEFSQRNIDKRKKEAYQFLLQMNEPLSAHVSISESDNIAREKVLEYIIQHIIQDELRYQTADRTELINITDDATRYICNVENTSCTRGETNTVFMRYIKNHYNLSIRDDHCCGNCGEDLFVGIPYCLNCNSMIRR